MSKKQTCKRAFGYRAAPLSRMQESFDIPVQPESTVSTLHARSRKHTTSHHATQLDTHAERPQETRDMRTRGKTRGSMSDHAQDIACMSSRKRRNVERMRAYNLKQERKQERKRKHTTVQAIEYWQVMSERIVYGSNEGHNMDIG